MRYRRAKAVRVRAECERVRRRVRAIMSAHRDRRTLTEVIV